MSNLPTKTNAGIMTAVISAILISVFGASDGDSFNGSAEAIKQNSDNFRIHEKLTAHPVAMNEFEHIHDELMEIKKDIQFAKEITVKTYALLCKEDPNC